MTRFVLILVILAYPLSCESRKEEAFWDEYDYEKYSERTAIHGVCVHFPEWLAAEDRDDVLASVDSYCEVLGREFPVDGFRYQDIHVWIHEAMPLCVAGWGLECWCYGWRERNYCFCCWNQLPSGEPSFADPLAVLPHEIMHMLLLEKYGDSDAGHDKYFPTDEVKNAVGSARAESLPVYLSSASVEGAVSYEYSPWCIPD